MRVGGSWGVLDRSKGSRAGVWGSQIRPATQEKAQHDVKEARWCHVAGYRGQCQDWDPMTVRYVCRISLYYFFFQLKFFLRDKYRKTTALNLSSHCGFKATQSKPFPRVAVSMMHLLSETSGVEDTSESRTGLPWVASVPKWCATVAAVETTWQRDRRSKPLPSLPGWCVSSGTCLYGCSSVPENLSQLPGPPSTSTRDTNQRLTGWKYVEKSVVPLVPR